MKLFFAPLLLLLSLFSQAQQQHRWHDDSTGQHNGTRPQMEKGPHKGPTFSKEGVKVEMVLPSNNKGDIVSYYVYDSLNKAVDTKLFSGTVKYVFGTSAEYLEARLIASAGNKYTTTLEGWQEYKKAIVTLKTVDKTYTLSFFNPNNTNQAQQGSGGHHGGHGHGGRHGGMGPGMGGNGTGSGSMGGTNGY